MFTNTYTRELDTVAESDDFPEEFFKVKVLPELLKSVEFGGGGPKVFALVMRISGKLTDEEYDAQITPVIVRLFGSPDRALRVCLLDNLPLMVDHLSQKTINDKIFPQMVSRVVDCLSKRSLISCHRLQALPTWPQSFVNKQ